MTRGTNGLNIILGFGLTTVGTLQSLVRPSDWAYTLVLSSIAVVLGCLTSIYAIPYLAIQYKSRGVLLLWLVSLALICALACILWLEFGLLHLPSTRRFPVALFSASVGLFSALRVWDDTMKEDASTSNSRDQGTSSAKPEG